MDDSSHYLLTVKLPLTDCAVCPMIKSVTFVDLRLEGRVRDLPNHLNRTHALV